MEFLQNMGFVVTGWMVWNLHEGMVEGDFLETVEVRLDMRDRLSTNR